MAETGTEKGFWHTAPGMITAVAALITALGGVLGILVQNDIIGGDASREVGDAPQVAADDRPPQSSQAPATGTPEHVPWAEATATLLRQDGTTATVKAPTVSLACGTEILTFENGQRVNLDLVRSIEFSAIYTENSSADAVVTMLDGRALTDPIHTWNCPVGGSNELGPLTVELEDIKRIDFDR